MDVEKMKVKKNVVLKAWERCRSLGNNTRKKSALMRKTRSCHNFLSMEEDNNNNNNRQKNKHSGVAPQGCFSVYVGPQRQRFVVKTEMANHPLFKVLLEDAELEYGFCSQGPLLLPCEVDLFYKVLAEIGDNNGDGDGEISACVCSFGYSPSRQRSRSISKGYGSYKLLPVIKLNSN